MEFFLALALLFDLFRLGLQLLQAGGDFAVQRHEGLRRALAPVQQLRVRQQAGECRQFFLQPLVVAGEGVALLGELLRRLCAGFTCRLPGLLQGFAALLQLEQFVLPLAGAGDAFAERAQFGAQPARTLGVGLRQQAGVQGRCVQPRRQHIQLGGNFRVALLDLFETGGEDSVAITQFLQMQILRLQGLAGAFGLAFVLLIEGREQCIGLVPGVLAAAAHRAGLARHQRRPQCLDIFAAGQPLAFEQIERDLERLLGRIAFAAGLFAGRYQVFLLGLQAAAFALQFGLARQQVLLAAPGSLQGFDIAFGLAPLRQLLVELSELFTRSGFAAELSLQLIQGGASLVLLGFGCLRALLQSWQFGAALLQACGQLYGLLQARAIAVPGRTQGLQSGAGFQLCGQFGEVLRALLLPVVQLLETRFGIEAARLDLRRLLADRREVGRQVLQAFLVATRLREPGFGFALRLFGALQLRRGLLAALLESGESILQALTSGLMPDQRLFDPAQQLLQLVLADEAMTLWRQLLEQGEDAAGVG